MTAQLLWQKHGIAIDTQIQDFLAGQDILLDRAFFLFDIQASIAHAEGLSHIGILTSQENTSLVEALKRLADAYTSGNFVLDARFEDGHSAIEAYLTEHLGDLGRKIHTGRSRNDQVLVATRLWLKEQLCHLQTVCSDVAGIALDRARAEGHIVMPGYTHLQRAVVSSTAMWWAAWAEAFIDNASRVQHTLQWIDCNPLGTAAGYGVNLPLDRTHTTQALGFARMQVSPMYTQLSRGKFEIAALDALSSATMDLRRLAWDLSLFSASEFGFITLPAQYATGSSIMPNKRNPDVIELMRATHAHVAAARAEIEHILSLPSGYHRDVQNTKGAVLRGFTGGMAALRLLPELLKKLQWKEDKLQASIDTGMFATDYAIDAAVAGVPFRSAYQAAAQAIDTAGQGRTALQSIQARVSPGAAANLCLHTLLERLKALTL